MPFPVIPRAKKGGIKELSPLDPSLNTYYYFDMSNAGNSTSVPNQASYRSWGSPFVSGSQTTSICNDGLGNYKNFKVACSSGLNSLCYYNANKVVDSGAIVILGNIIFLSADIELFYPIRNAFSTPKTGYKPGPVSGGQSQSTVRINSTAYQKLHGVLDMPLGSWHSLIIELDSTIKLSLNGIIDKYTWAGAVPVGQSNSRPAISCDNEFSGGAAGQMGATELACIKGPLTVDQRTELMVYLQNRTLEL